MSESYTYKPASMSVKAFFAEMINQADDKTEQTLLDCAVVHLKTAYMAVKMLDRQTGNTQVLAFIGYLKYLPRQHSNFAYNIFSEEALPDRTQAPKRILTLLTPTDNAYAQEWRMRCWEKIARRVSRPRLSHGMIVRHKTGEYFEVIDSRRHCYRLLKSGEHCGLPPEMSYEMEICTAADVALLQSHTGAA